MELIEARDEIGGRLGHEAVDHIVKIADDYCQSEARRIEAANQAPIQALRAEASLLSEEEKDLKERLRQAPPLGDLRGRRRRALYYWVVALFLAGAGYFFSLIALDPFRLGWKGHLCCLGVAVVSPLLTDKFLEVWGNPKIIRWLTAVGLVAALAGIVLLALIRGDVLAQYLQNVSPVVILGQENVVSPPPQTHFYEQTVARLRFFMALLALAMEIGAGIALHDARRLGSDSGDDPTALRRELLVVHSRMLEIIHEITRLQNEAAVFVARFWRDFYRAMLNGTVRSALSKLSLIVGAFLVLGSPLAYAGERFHLVVAIDLSKSVAVEGYDNHTEFEKNRSAVGHLLSGLPAGSRVTVLGITNNSFSQPFILLAAQLDSDEGYFKERLATARQQTLAAWRKRSNGLEAKFLHTDVFGALVVAGQFLQQELNGKRVLVLFSDMRHDTLGIDLERPHVVHVSRLLPKVETAKLVANLNGVEVYALGVDAAGKSVAYWATLRSFWAEYFRKSGATLKSFSIARELPQLNSGP